MAKKKDEQQQNKGGRPPINIDPKQVQYLAAAFCTNEEIAAKLGCSADTLTRRFADALKEGRDSAKASIRAKQYSLAMKGNVTLLIWLGKQYLGQSDKVDMTPNEDQSPRQHTVVFKRYDGKEKNH